MVEFIKYRGQEFPFVYNYYVISRLKKVSKEISEEEMFEHMLYYGIEAGCWEKDIEMNIEKGGKVRPLTPKDCAFIIADIGIEKVNELIKSAIGGDNSNQEDKKKLK